MNKKLLYSLAATALFGLSATAFSAAQGEATRAADDGYTLSVSPVSGSTVSSISQVSVKWNSSLMEEASMDWEFNVQNVTITRESDNTVYHATEFGEMDASGVSILFPTISEPGTYNFYFPEGFLIEYDWNKDQAVEGGKKSNAVTATYTIGTSGGDQPAAGSLSTYTLSPESGETLAEIQKVLITFPNVDYGRMWGSQDGKTISFTNGSTEYQAFAMLDWTYEDATRLSITPVDTQENPVTISEAGTWYLYIEGGAFELDGELSPEIFAEYTVSSNGGSATIENYTLSPENYAEVGKLKSVKITFPDYNLMSELNVADDAQQATLTNGQHTATYKAEASPLWENMTKEFEFTFYDENDNQVTITEDGLWTLNVPAGYFEVGSVKTDAISATYVLDSSIKPDVKWSADPANGSSIETPAGTVYNFNFNFSGVESVSYDAISNSDIAGIRVTYNGVGVKEVANTLGTGEDYQGWQLSDNWGDASAVIRINTGVFAQPGVLSIEIDEGRFTLDDDIPSPAISYTCTVGDYKEYTYELLPSNKEAVNDLTEFTLSFPTATTAEVNESQLYITLSNGSWGAPGNPEITAVENAEHPTFKIVFSSNPDKNGNYTLMIDEGSFTLDGKQGSPMIRETYNFSKGTAVNWEWKPSPDTDLVIDTYGIYPAIVFNESETLGAGSEFANISIVLNGTTLTSSQFEKGISSDNNAVYFSIFEPELLVPGTLTVNIPAGAIRLSGETNTEAISYTWNVVNPKSYSYTLAPAFGASEEEATTVSSLDKITLTIDDVKSSSVFSESGISLRSTDYSYFGTAKIEADATTPGKYTLTFDPAPSVDMVYHLEIRWETFTLDGSFGWPSDYKDIEGYYNLKAGSGLTSIEADENGLFTVVSVDGKVILKDAKASELENLAKGLYIINGKKTMIK